MRHVGDDDLVLLHYGDGADAEAAAHVAACDECRTRLASLRELLAALPPPSAPERPADYGAQVWERLQPRLAAGTKPARVLRFFGTRAGRRVTGLVAVAASLILAFVLGQKFPTQPQALSPAVRERILLVAIGDHLERSQLVLIELANAPTDASMDVAASRASANDLVSANRLYRQSASRSGETGLVAVLEELERVLLEVATGPERLSAADLGELQRRIESRGLLFKVRVIGSQVREREKAALPRTPSAS